jgi:hypothetical protein
LETAVNKKPAIVAITKPNSISCMCQESAPNRLGRFSPMIKITVQRSRAAADHRLAIKKNGRNPYDRKAGTTRCAPRRSAMLT